MEGKEINLAGKRVLLTGGNGFLGRHTARALEGEGAVVCSPSSRQYDLRDQVAARQLFADFKPEIVIHGAVHGGGIGYMREHPGEVCYDNLLMNTHVLHETHRFGCEKFVGIGTICSYPKITPVPFKEEALWDGYPEETNGPYGVSKKVMLVHGQSYHDQYGFNAIHLLLVNMFGPGDDFQDASSHVIPAFIKRFSAARDQQLPNVVCWGDGSPTREFLYVEDAARAIVLATKRYHKPAAVNIGTGTEITIRELAEQIARAVGYQGELTWDTSKPNGQPRRCLDVQKARDEFGFTASTDLAEGLRKTLAWYEGSRKKEFI